VKRFIKEAGRGPKGAKALSVDDACEAAGMMLEGRATDAQSAALLLALRMKGDAAEEIAGFTQALRLDALSLELDDSFRAGLCDCAGPHDGRKSFAATIPVAVLSAMAGLPTLLHASESLPPKLGLSLQEILQALGLNPALSSPATVAAELKQHGLGYVNTEAFVPGLAGLRRLREEIGVRSIFNHAEKLVDYARAGVRVVGVHHASAFEKLTQVSAIEGSRLLLLQGNDGSEDLPVHRRSIVLVADKGEVRRIEIDPETLGLDAGPREAYNLETQAALITRVLSGEEDPAIEPERRLVLLNTAVRLWLSGKEERLESAVERAWDLLASGQGLTKMTRWLKASPQMKRAA
jgi:anthranilate phosphoribosyltransferase